MTTLHFAKNPLEAPTLLKDFLEQAQTKRTDLNDELVLCHREIEAFTARAREVEGKLAKVNAFIQDTESTLNNAKLSSPKRLAHRRVTTAYNRARSD